MRNQPHGNRSKVSYTGKNQTLQDIAKRRISGLTYSNTLVSLPIEVQEKTVSESISSSHRISSVRMPRSSPAATTFEPSPILQGTAAFKMQEWLRNEAPWAQEDVFNVLPGPLSIPDSETDLEEEERPRSPVYMSERERAMLRALDANDSNSAHSSEDPDHLSPRSSEGGNSIVSW